MTKAQDKARRGHLRNVVQRDLLDRGEIEKVDGMAVDANVVKGDIESWVWRVKLTSGTVYTYTMNNTDDAPVHCNGDVVGQ